MTRARRVVAPARGARAPCGAQPRSGERGAHVGGLRIPRVLQAAGETGRGGTFPVRLGARAEPGVHPYRTLRHAAQAIFGRSAMAIARLHPPGPGIVDCRGELESEGGVARDRLGTYPDVHLTASLVADLVALAEPVDLHPVKPPRRRSLAFHPQGHVAGHDPDVLDQAVHEGFHRLGQEARRGRRAAAVGTEPGALQGRPVEGGVTVQPRPHVVRQQLHGAGESFSNVHHGFLGIRRPRLGPERGPGPGARARPPAARGPRGSRGPTAPLRRGPLPRVRDAAKDAHGPDRRRVLPGGRRRDLRFRLQPGELLGQPAALRFRRPQPVGLLAPKPLFLGHPPPLLRLDPRALLFFEPLPLVLFGLQPRLERGDLVAQTRLLLQSLPFPLGGLRPLFFFPTEALLLLPAEAGLFFRTQALLERRDLPAQARGHHCRLGLVHRVRREQEVLELDRRAGRTRDDRGQRTDRERELALVLPEHQPVSLFRGDLQASR